jgi:DNA-binding GntR family transcriptional regulator
MTPDDLRLRAEAAIRHRIVSGAVPFGARLSDRTLAAELGISRTPVREALGRLAKEGLVVIRPQSGSFVMAPDAAAIRAVCEMRAVLECGALRLAAGADPDRLAAALAPLVAGATLALEAADLLRAEALDSAFHAALVEAAGNPLLARAYRGIADQVGALRHRLPRDAARMARAVAQHRRVLDLALAGRLAEAEAELAAHVRNVQGQAVALLRAAVGT